jgi:hypothetical protein
MKISIDNGHVSIFSPALDASGKPRTLPGGEPMGISRTMTLEQYEKHKRDPLFVDGAAPLELAAVTAAIEAAAAGTLELAAPSA